MNTKQTLHQYLEDHAEDYFRDEKGNLWLGKDVYKAAEEGESAVHVINGALYLRAQEGMPLVALNLWPIASLRPRSRWPDPAETIPLDRASRERRAR